MSTDFDDIFRTVALATSNKCIDFVGYPDHDAHLGIFKGILLLSDRSNSMNFADNFKKVVYAFL